MRVRCSALALAAASWSWCAGVADETMYVARGSAWRYFLGTTEASSPDTAAWRTVGFADGGWSEGPAPIGFGEPPQATVIPPPNPPSQPNYSCVYLRKTFQAGPPGQVGRFSVRALYDDGIVVWINGTEVLRANVSASTVVTFDAVADRAATEPRTFEELELPQPGSYLLEGSNVIAVQLFNNRVDSSDLNFDLELFDPLGPDTTPPAVEALVPAASATIRSLAQIEVTFTEEVVGVDASDLRVSGSAATSVSGAGRGPWIFRFSGVPEGTVQASWSAQPAILDLAEPPNAFVPPAPWSYTVDPDAPAADVVISEILASNANGLADEDGETSDWIEIRNRSGIAVDLGGWALTDEAGVPGKWVFPSVTLGAGGYLVVFASGKDRKTSPLHASFRLSADGEYLALLDAESPRRVVSELAPRFPEQRADTSWGLVAGGQMAYLDPPTPGAANDTSAVRTGFVADPRISPTRGFYDASVTVELYTATPEATIWYTLDGREPTPTTGTRYTAPFSLQGTARKAGHTVRAMASRTGFLPSRVITSTYVFPANVPTQPADPTGFPASWGGGAPAADYGMDPEIAGSVQYRDVVLDGLLDVPSLSIVLDVADMFGASGIYSNPTGEGVAWERPCSVELLDPEGRDGWQVNCGIRIQGGASREPAKSPKHSLRLLFKGDYGPTRLRERFFPDAPIDSFDTIVLRADFNNSWIHWDAAQRARGTLLRDQFARETQLAMGRLGSHGTYVHVYVNGLYWGLYNPVERPSAPFAASYLGGEEEEYDALNSAVAVDGNLSAWSTLISVAGANLANLSAYETVGAWLDVPGFADYMLLNLYGGNEDWPHQNWYGVRKRETGAVWRFVCWDSERTLEGNTVDKTGVSNANSPGYLWQRLRLSPEFRLLVADAARRHLLDDGVLTPQAASARWLDLAGRIDKAVACESARWGDYRRDVHPYSNGPYLLYTRDAHFHADRDRLVGSYFPARTGILLNQLRAAGLYPATGAPVLGRHGGTIAPGFSLTISRPAGTSGTIWYTTDGTDPRTYGSGDVSPEAAAYSGPIVLSESTVVKARIQNGAEWSALTEAVFSVVSPLDAVRIAEIHYHPDGDGETEFVELRNTSSLAVDISSLAFTSGITFVVPRGTVVAGGQHVVLVANPAAFAARYPGVHMDGAYTGRLDNAGEKLTLQTSAGETVESVEYNDAGAWPLGPDGFGFSLVRAAVDGHPDDPRNWRASAHPGGSPGSVDPAPLHGGVIPSEILARPTADVEDAVELANLSDRPVDVGGWFLSDERVDADALRKFRIPSRTVIPAGGFLVLYQDAFDPEPGAWPSFELGGNGGAVYLASADPSGNLTGHIAGRTFDASDPGVPLGVHETSVSIDFTALARMTFGADDPASVEEFRTGRGAPNDAPRVGPVVISEISYHPGPGGEEFLELANVSGAPVDVGGWLVDGIRDAAGAGDYAIPAGTSLPEGGHLVIVPGDPASFRALLGVPAGVPVVGPYAAVLDDGGESIRLLRPSGEGTGRVVVDRVVYNDRDPWPLEPDGEGPTLERVRASEYGNEPLNWAASLEAGGTPGRENGVSEPGVNQRPVAAFATAPGTAPLRIAFDASSSEDFDGRIVRFSWDFGDGSTGTGAALEHAFAAGGVYQVSLTVEDNAGATGSARRSVSVSGAPEGWQVPGDANQDGAFDISDPVTLLLWLFVEAPDLAPCDGGTDLTGGNRILLDLDQSGTVSITDAIRGLDWLFRGGPGPALGTGCVRIAGCRDACVP